ncbi:unnamed protein product [Ambrosiozyma monospora]|uniref:Unnamed protein product n=1 Tax=Ambrosiozyma monospora TaxID=43982 RepID=A0ACB5T9Y0_AMBMO|nr:unnamed protein product [Ambrosiozyma monospora]
MTAASQVQNTVMMKGSSSIQKTSNSYNNKLGPRFRIHLNQLMDLTDLFKAQNLKVDTSLHDSQSPESPHSPEQQHLEETLRELDLNDSEEDQQEGEQFPGTFIDKGELTEISVENDGVLLSPHTSRSGSLSSSGGEEDYTDDSFKDSFNEDFEEQEIDGLTNYKLILEYPEINFKYEQVGPLSDEINDWFNFTQLKDMPSIIHLGHSYLDGFVHLSEHDQLLKVESLVSDILNNKEDDVAILKNLIQLLYIQFGLSKASDQDQQEMYIVEHSRLFLHETVLPPLLELLEDRAIKMTDIKNDELLYTSNLLKAWSKQFFYLMTIVYFQLLVNSTGNMTMQQSAELTKIVSQSNLVVSLTKAVDRFRWLTSEIDMNQDLKPDLQNHYSKTLHLFQLKNVLMLLHQSILTIFGGIEKRNSTKDYLKFRFTQSHHDKKDSHHIDSITPFDYMYYRTELTTRYPTYAPPKIDLSVITESILKDSQSFSDTINTNSLLINQQHNFKSPLSSNLSVQPPDIHLATPMPSPTLNPQHTGSSLSNSNISELEHTNGETKKKMFVTQPNFPNIYPLDKEVPFSIKEASNIFYNHIKESVSSKQFISTFEGFIKDEQGLDCSSDVKNMFKFTEKDAKENPMFKDEIDALMRVDAYYTECLPFLGSLVSISMQMISSNIMYPVGLGDEKITNQTRTKLQQHRQRQVMAQENVRPYVSSKLSRNDKERLEIIRNKEISLKAATNLLVMLLRWFKASHILKFEYLNSLIFDNDFFRLLINFLDGNKFATQFTNKNYDLKDPSCLINNRLVYCDYECLYKFEEYNFFRKCCGIHYKSDSFLPETVDSIRDEIFNENSKAKLQILQYYN